MSGSALRVLTAAGGVGVDFGTDVAECLRECPLMVMPFITGLRSSGGKGGSMRSRRSVIFLRRRLAFS